MFRPEAPPPQEILEKFEILKGADYYHLNSAIIEAESTILCGSWVLARVQYKDIWDITQIVQIAENIVRTSSGIDFRKSDDTQIYSSVEPIQGACHAILYDLDKAIALHRQHLEAEAAVAQARNRHDAEYFGERS